MSSILLRLILDAADHHFHQHWSLYVSYVGCCLAAFLAANKWKINKMLLSATFLAARKYEKFKLLLGSIFSSNLGFMIGENICCVPYGPWYITAPSGD
jgi:hypothetical protein